MLKWNIVTNDTSRHPVILRAESGGHLFEISRIVFRKRPGKPLPKGEAYGLSYDGRGYYPQSGGMTFDTLEAAKWQAEKYRKKAPPLHGMDGPIVQLAHEQPKGD